MVASFHILCSSSDIPCCIVWVLLHNQFKLQYHHPIILRYDSVGSALEQHFLTGGTLQFLKLLKILPLNMALDLNSCPFITVPFLIILCFPPHLSILHYVCYLLKQHFQTFYFHCPLIYCGIWIISFSIHASAFHCVCMLLSAFLLVVSYDICYLQVTLCNRWNMGC